MVKRAWVWELLPLFHTLPAEEENEFKPEIDDSPGHVKNLLQNLTISKNYSTLAMQRNISNSRKRCRDLCTEIRTNLQNDTGVNGKLSTTITYANWVKKNLTKGDLQVICKSLTTMKQKHTMWYRAYINETRNVIRCRKEFADVIKDIRRINTEHSLEVIKNAAKKYKLKYVQLANHLQKINGIIISLYKLRSLCTDTLLGVCTNFKLLQQKLEEFDLLSTVGQSCKIITY